MFNSNRNTNFNPNDNTGSFKRQLLRYTTWTIFAHPAAFALMTSVLIVAISVGLPVSVTAVLLIVIPFAESRLLRRNIGPRRLVMWANVVRFRRHWFTIWTSNINAQSDHTTQGLGLYPVLSIIPRFKGNIGYFIVRPPSGHTLEYVAEISDTLAAHSPDVSKINVIYKRPTDSYGIFEAVFGETNPVTNPNWDNPPTAPSAPTKPPPTPASPAPNQTKDHINEPV